MKFVELTRLEEWQTATEILMSAAEGRDFLMHARIGAAGAEPPRRPRVQHRSQRDALGKAEAEAGGIGFHACGSTPLNSKMQMISG
jgi:hypothetical protein